MEKSLLCNLRGFGISRMTDKAVTDRARLSNKPESAPIKFKIYPIQLSLCRDLYEIEPRGFLLLTTFHS